MIRVDLWNTPETLAILGIALFISVIAVFFLAKTGFNFVVNICVALVSLIVISFSGVAIIQQQEPWRIGSDAFIEFGISNVGATDMDVMLCHPDLEYAQTPASWVIDEKRALGTLIRETDFLGCNFTLVSY